MPKHNQQKWLLAGLLPGLAGLGWLVSRRLRRPRVIPPSSALVPINQTPQITVTGAAPVVEAQVETNPLPRVGQAASTTRTYPDRVEDREATRTPAGVYEKPLKDQAAGGSQSMERTPGVEQPERRLPGYALEEHTTETASFLVLLIPFVALVIAIAIMAFYRTPVQSSVVVPGGDAGRGQVYLQAWGCGSCHTITGVAGADGKVGPNLNEVGLHSFVAGHLQNTPDNMIQWIMHPQQVSPGTGMPDTGVPDNVARDMAAYLYSLNSRQRSSSLNFNRR